MFASLTPNSRIAVVSDTGAVSRRNGNQERDIRRAFVERDLVIPSDQVEAVVLLPENLFFNTSAPGIILVFNRAKPYPGEILLINASKLCVKGGPMSKSSRYTIFTAISRPRRRAPRRMSSWTEF